MTVGGTNDDEEDEEAGVHNGREIHGDPPAFAADDDEGDDDDSCSHYPHHDEHKNAEAVERLIFNELSTEQFLALFRPLNEGNSYVLSFDGTSSFLHEALQYFCDKGMDLAVIRLRGTPDLLLRKTKYDETPQYLARRHYDDAGVLYLLDQSGPKQLRLKCDQNALPLHAACDNDALSSHTVLRIMEGYAEALGLNRAQGETPATLALASRRWDSPDDHPLWPGLCRGMLRATPESVRDIQNHELLIPMADKCRKY